jgi:hypothetical protein
MNRYACSKRVDYMEAHYKVGIHSPKTFVTKTKVKSILKAQLQ